MVHNTRNNDSQSCPSDPPMVDATLEVTSQQSPEISPTVGVVGYLYVGFNFA